jgi:hypothetical protein
MTARRPTSGLARPEVSSKKTEGLLGKCRKRQRNKENGQKLRFAPRNQKNPEEAPRSQDHKNIKA